jgi:hypothetical protein
MESLYSIFPDVDVLLKVSPEDLGGTLLGLAPPRVQSAGFIPNSVTRTPLHDAVSGRDYPFQEARG